LLSAFSFLFFRWLFYYRFSGISNFYGIFSFFFFLKIYFH
jgi:hypothetical protein